MDWGQYLFIRDRVPELLEEKLSRKKTWRETKSGKGVVLLCSGTDPYQNKQTATVTCETIQVLNKYNKRVRILTRGLLWPQDLDILVRKNIIVGMSLPFLDDELSRKIEPHAPPPSKRYETLIKGRDAGCRLYVAVAPTPPMMTRDDFRRHLEKVMELNPETIFWEPINARGTNGKRMAAAGLDFVQSVMTKTAWADCFKRQWEDIQTVAQELNCEDRLYIWVDRELKGLVSDDELNRWFYKPTVEQWEDLTNATSNSKSRRQSSRQSKLTLTA